MEFSWEMVLKNNSLHMIVFLFLVARNLHFSTMDMTRHTHSSAWHTMHNVICGGAKSMDEFLEILSRSRVKIFVVHGDGDQIVPLECSTDIRTKLPNAKLHIIKNTDHTSVILGREHIFTQFLEHTWLSFNGREECSVQPTM